MQVNMVYYTGYDGVSDKITVLSRKRMSCGNDVGLYMGVAVRFVTGILSGYLVEIC